MAEAKKRVPKRRFKEFSGEWEERKLSSLGNTFTGLSGKTKEDFGHGEGRFVTYMNVFSNSIADSQNVGVIEIDESQNKVKYGDVFFTTSSETPEEVGMSTVWLENTDNVYLNSFCFGYRPTVEIDPFYLAYMLRAPGVRNNIKLLAQGISRYNISKTKVMEIEVPIPKDGEQIKLGAFFKTLDTLITLHQRKLDKIKSTKKAYLSEMFPAEGETKPKRRFKGFSGEWEVRKLEDLSDSFEYGLNAAAKEFDGKNKYIRITDIDEETRLYLNTVVSSPNIDISSADNFMLKYGDILFARTGASVGKSYIYRDTDGLVYYAGFLIRARIKKVYNPEFVFYNTLTEKYKEYIRVTSQRSGQPGVNAQEYSQYTIKVPKYDEQVRIGAYFTNLDTLITLHQQKLDKLKNLKKSYLNEMFI